MLRWKLLALIPLHKSFQGSRTPWNTYLIYRHSYGYKLIAHLVWCSHSSYLPSLGGPQTEIQLDPHWSNSFQPAPIVNRRKSLLPVTPFYLLLDSRRSHIFNTAYKLASHVLVHHEQCHRWFGEDYLLCSLTIWGWFAVYSGVSPIPIAPLRAVLLWSLRQRHRGDMKNILKPGQELTFTSPPGKSTEINISFFDGTVISTVLSSRGVFNITAGTSINDIQISYKVLDDGAIGISD